MAHRINASVVKAWFQYRCERKTRYEMLAPPDLAQAGIVEVTKEQSWAFIGDEFERRVVARLGGGVIRPAGSKSGLYAQVAKAFLMGERAEPFAHQMDLGTSVGAQSLSLPPGVAVGSTLADLIRRDDRDGVPAFTVIDIKATRRATSFHKAQVAFYAILLEAFIQTIGCRGRVAEAGEIWHVRSDGDAATGDHAVEVFSLAPYKRMVAAFCEADLPRILAARIAPGINETFFHVYFKCEQCQFLAKHCIDAVSAPRPPGARDVSAVAGVTHEAKRTLLRMGLGTIDPLASAEDLMGRPGLGWSLQRRAATLVLRASAIEQGKALRTAERYSLLMPPRVDAGIYLLADFDPVGDRLASIACLIDPGRGMGPTWVVRVLPSDSRADEANAVVAVFGAVVAALGEIDEHNADLDVGSPEAIHAHIFMFEAAEAAALQGAIARHLGDPRVRQGLLNMVRLFPPEDVVPEPEFRGIHHLPATAVRMVLEQLYALPVTVSYDLAQSSQALEAAGMATAYRPSPPFVRPFSSLLSIDVIKEMELRGARGLQELTEADARARLDVLRAMVAFLIAASAEQARGPDGPMLRLAKRPFRFWQTFDPIEAIDLEVLQAFELVENRAGLLATMVGLARPIDRRADSGRCMAALKLARHSNPTLPHVRLTFDVPVEARTAEIGPDTFGLVLSDGDQNLLLDYASWPDIECEIVPEWKSGAGAGQIEVSMKAKAFHSVPFQAMFERSRDGDWVIDQVFKDFNTERIAGYLQHLAAGSEP